MFSPGSLGFLKEGQGWLCRDSPGQVVFRPQRSAWLVVGSFDGGTALFLLLESMRVILGLRFSLLALRSTRVVRQWPLL